MIASSQLPIPQAAGITGKKNRIRGARIVARASSDAEGLTIVGAGLGGGESGKRILYLCACAHLWRRGAACAGRVGEAFIALGSNPKDKLIRRGEGIPEDCPGAIIVCTRNNDLQGVVDATPASRRQDLVFIQNGMLQPWLDERGLGDNTQALIYFAVAKKGRVSWKREPGARVEERMCMCVISQARSR